MHQLIWRPLALIRRRPRTSLGVLVFALGIITPIALHFWALRHFEAAQEALDDDRLTEALDHNAVCLTIWPFSAETHFQAGRIARMRGDYPRASDELNECKKLQNGLSLRTSLEMLLVRAQDGEMDQVEESLVAVAARDPQNARLILEGLARGHMNAGRLVPALDYLNKCLKRYPDDLRALEWRARVFHDLFLLEPAVADYQRLLELAPGRTEARIRLATLFLESNNPTGAEPHLAALQQVLPNRREVQMGWAMYHFQRGETAEARTFLDRVLAAHPDDPAAHLYRGRVALQEARLTDAEADLRQALDEDHNILDARWSFYLCLQKQGGRDGEAEAELAEFHRIQADQERLNVLQAENAARNPDKEAEAGELYLRLGRERVGVYWLEEALAAAPGNKRAHKALADYYEKKGDGEQAARHRRQAE